MEQIIADAEKKVLAMKAKRELEGDPSGNTNAKYNP